MCILPRKGQEILQKALERLPKNFPRSGGQGSNCKNRRYYPAWAAVQLLAKTKLCYGEKENTKSDINSGGKRRRAIFEHTNQEAVEQTIFLEIHNKQYIMTGDAQICNHKLFTDFDYTANMPASKAVLDGTYVAPRVSVSATCDLFAKIAAICNMIPKDPVSLMITPAPWKQYWKIVKKETFSFWVRVPLWTLYCGLQVGHYLTLPCSLRLNDPCPCHHTREMVMGTVSDAEENSLEYSGDKAKGHTFYEADFNATNKIFYGNQMLHNEQNHNHSYI